MVPVHVEDLVAALHELRPAARFNTDREIAATPANAAKPL
jgi:hypothetical protein